MQWMFTSRKWSFEQYTESRLAPTLPDGTEVKKGEPPRMFPSSKRWEGLKKSSTSARHANWGIRVSSFVETMTVLESSGSICTLVRPHINDIILKETQQCERSLRKKYAAGRLLGDSSLGPVQSIMQRIPSSSRTDATLCNICILHVCAHLSSLKT